MIELQGSRLFVCIKTPTAVFDPVLAKSTTEWVMTMKRMIIEPERCRIICGTGVRHRQVADAWGCQTPLFNPIFGCSDNPGDNDMALLSGSQSVGNYFINPSLVTRAFHGFLPPAIVIGDLAILKKIEPLNSMVPGFDPGTPVALVRFRYVALKATDICLYQPDLQEGSEVWRC